MTIQQTLAEMKERADKATPGPWRFDNDRNQYVIVSDAYEPVLPVCMSFDNVDSGSEPMDDEQSDRNSRFIAAARTDVTCLVRALEHALSQLNHSDWCAHWSHGECDCTKGNIESRIDHILNGEEAKEQV